MVTELKASDMGQYDKIKAYLAEHPDEGAIDISKGCGVPLDSARTRLQTMYRAGILVRTERGRYRLADGIVVAPSVETEKHRTWRATKPDLDADLESSEGPVEAEPAEPRQSVFVPRVTAGRLEVMTAEEAEWYEHTKGLYQAQTAFTETTDLQDLDRLLGLELLVHRWVGWLAAGHDYDGCDLDEKALKTNLRDYSDQISKLKDSMSLSRKARDAASSSGDFATAYADLLRRAKEFGLHREKTVTKTLVLMNQFSSIVGSFDRSDKEEREKLGFPDEHSILEWVRLQMIPQFRELDEAWINSTQKYFTIGRAN